jgi:electron transport complex protein RnfG
MSKITNTLASFFRQGWLLIVCFFILCLLIAFANKAWIKRGGENKIADLNTLMAALVPQAKSFDIVVSGLEVKDANGTVSSTDIYKAVDDNGKTIGFAFVAAGKGYHGMIKLVIAADSACTKILGYNVIQSDEEPGFLDAVNKESFKKQFAGAPVGKLELISEGQEKAGPDQIVAVSGATTTCEAIVNVLNNYINAVKDTLKEKGLVTSGI